MQFMKILAKQFSSCIRGSNCFKQRYLPIVETFFNNCSSVTVCKFIEVLLLEEVPAITMVLVFLLFFLTLTRRGRGAQSVRWRMQSFGLPINIIRTKITGPDRKKIVYIKLYTFLHKLLRAILACDGTSLNPK